MAKQTINIGTAPNDGTGTPLRTAFQYTNSNFSELYTAVGPSGNNIVVPGSATITGDLTVRTNKLSVTSTGVGIGMATPSYSLDINGAANFLAGTIHRCGGQPIFTQSADAATTFLYAGSTFLSIRNQANTQEIFNLTPAGVYTFGDGAGGTRMTLNSTGLGVGVTPAVGFELQQTSPMARITSTSTTGYSTLTLRNTGASGRTYGITVGGSGTGATAAGNLYISDDTASAIRLTLDSSGNVGVGVTPSAWGSNYKVIESAGNASAMFAGANVNGVGLSSNVYNDNTNWLYKTTGTAARFAVNTSQFQWFIAPSGTAGNAITFTQAMTLDASGNLLVGTTTNTNSSRVFIRGTGGAAGLAIQSATGDLAQPGLLVGKFDNDSTTSQILVRFTINNNASGSGQINANGANQAAFGSFSDSRLKENIVSLPSQLANILSLRPVEFDYKDGSGHQIGFVAQEMQEVYSDAVGEQNGFLTVTGWSKTEARLVSAIKELAAKVQALEAKLA